jgi:SAM-dependent methyltransferase
VLVAGPGITDPVFLQDGAVGAAFVLETLERHGVAFGELEAILDWGCGCGRILCHWQDVSGPRFHGCDSNAELVQWCQQNLLFATTSQNLAMPPLPYDDESFDFIYGFSVFTHLSEEAHYAWIVELRRVLKQGACLLFTTHGDAPQFLEPLDGDELRRFHAGEFVGRVRTQDGRTYVTAWHPKRWVERRLLAGTLQLLEYMPLGAVFVGRQDAWLVRKPA